MQKKRLLSLFLLGSVFLKSSSIPVIDSSETSKAKEEPSEYVLHYKHSVFERERRRLHNIPVMNWFMDRVGRWSQEMQTMLLDNHIAHDLLLKKLQRLCNKMFQAKNEKQAGQLLQELLKVYEMLQKTQSNTQDQETIEYFHCALLAKSSVILVHSAVVNLLRVLDVLTECQEYWIMQERHPWRYYFHKSPLKWFNKDSQYAEVGRNKKVITKVLEKYDRVLGQIIHFIHSFDAQASVEKQYNWLHQLTQIINLIVAGAPEQSNSKIGFTSIAHSFINQYTLLPHHINKVLRLMDHAQKPNHFVRHWFAYTVLMGGIIYCYLDPHLALTTGGAAIIDWYRKKDETGLNFFERWVVKPFGEFKSIVLEAPDDSMLQIDHSVKLRDGIIEQLALMEKKEDPLTQTFKQADAFLQEDIKKVIDRLMLNETEEQKEKILATILNQGDMSPLWNYVNSPELESLYGLGWQGKPVIKNADTLKDQMLDVLLAKIDLAEKGIRANLGPTLIETQKNLLAIQLAALNDVIGSVRSTNTNVKKHDLSLKILALAPAGLGGLGLFKTVQKIYKRLVHHDYRKVNNLLCDVEKVLIKSTDTMNYALYGRLIHLLHQIKTSAYACVPTKNDIGYKFIADIQELESYDFSPREKEKLIVLMRQRYTFLK